MWNPLDLSWHAYWFTLGAVAALWAVGVGSFVLALCRAASRRPAAPDSFVPDTIPSWMEDEGTEWVGRFPPLPASSEGGTVLLACGHLALARPVVFLPSGAGPMYACPSGCGPRREAE